MKNAKVAETIRGALADVENMGLITREIHSFYSKRVFCRSKRESWSVAGGIKTLR